MILQQLGWSYGHLRQMQSMQKAVQLLHSVCKANIGINVVYFKKHYSTCICDMSCIYGRYNNLILSKLF